MSLLFFTRTHPTLSLSQGDLTEASSAVFMKYSFQEIRLVIFKEVGKTLNMMTIPYERSFASHPRASCWHPTKNGDITPRDVFNNSHEKCWFVCDNCPHSFDAFLYNITKGKWCPYCSKPCKKLCGEEGCRFCYEKSFASHPRASCWHPTKNGGVKPRNVKLGSNEKRWFSCDKCPHSFETPVDKINIGRWCPYCTNQKLCKSEDCQYCFEKSFASHPRASCWHPTKNGDVKPCDVFKGSSNQKRWFVCDNCLHSFDMSLDNIIKGKWCPMCINKTEKKIYDALNEHYPIIEREFKVKWCKNIKTNRYYPFDFCIESKKVIIELDGRQHFEDIKHWNSSFEDRHSIDLVKQLDANDNGYRVIRMIQMDVWLDKYDWLTELLKNIEDDTHQNVFMCKDDEYDFFNKSINHRKSASAV